MINPLLKVAALWAFATCAFALDAAASALVAMSCSTIRSNNFPAHCLPHSSVSSKASVMVVEE